mmetsp:Transcript_28192/g.77820  ORF Transcript_28192/g.77820 Transcript_28192/m.77820 type:complete len:435 (+) Transcript_28192:110-1414(+)
MQGLLEEAVGSVRACCTWAFPGLDYPKLETEVVRLLSQYRFTPRHVCQMHRVFMELKSHDPMTLRSGSEEISCAGVARLVRHRREWVEDILAGLLELGGYKDVVSWNGFVYVLVKFCSLSRLEIAQVMFLIVSMRSKSWTVQFLTLSQLEEYYMPFVGCPCKSFDATSVNFRVLPMAKYRIVDYIQLTYRFCQLINPCLYLQRSLQRSLPSVHFWKNYDVVTPTNQKITLHSFRTKKISSLTDLLFGISAQDAPAQLQMPLAMQPKVDEWDSKTQIKRWPPVDTDMHIPGLGPGAVGWAPPRAPRPPMPPPTPAWISDEIEAQEDITIRRPTAASVPNWSLPLPASATVEDAKIAIIEGHRAMTAWERTIYEADGEEHVVNARPPSDIRRQQELDFILKNRTVEDPTESVVSALARQTTCELIARPGQKKQVSF